MGSDNVAVQGIGTIRWTFDDDGGIEPHVPYPGVAVRTKIACKIVFSPTLGTRTE
jgi:hypothetical protein